MRTLKKTLALVLVLAMVFSLCVTASADFTDAEEIQYPAAVELLTALGVIEGYPDGSFGATKTLNRAEAAIIIARLNAYTGKAATPSYTDMAGYGWANPAVAFCENEGIVNGTGAGKFEPASVLTGYMWLKMLAVSMGYDAVEYGMTGAAWEVGVAKLNKVLNLTAGIEGIDLSKEITREEAAQCAFNALLAERDGDTWVVIHETLEKGAHPHFFSSEEAALKFFAADAERCELPMTGDFVTSLGFEKFGLIGIDQDYDMWGNPGYGWYSYTLGFVTYTAYEPTLSFTGEVTDAELFTALAAEGVKVSSYITTEKYINVEQVWMDGVERGEYEVEKGLNYWVPVTGNGTESYFYADTLEGDVFVNIQQFIGIVTEEMPANSITGADAYVVLECLCVGGDCTDHVFTFYNSDLKLGDIVVWNECYGEVVNMHAPATVTGTVDKLEWQTATPICEAVVTIDGEEYQLSKHNAITPADVAGGMTATWFVDDQGFLMLLKETESFQYKIGFLKSYDAQNAWAGDKNHPHSVDAYEKFEIMDITTGETTVYDGALTVAGGNTTFATGVVVPNTWADNADVYDLNGTAYNVQKGDDLSTGLVVFLTNDAGEIFYISDTQTKYGEMLIQNTAELETKLNDIWLYSEGEVVPAWQNDDTQYVYTAAEAYVEFDLAKGLKNAKNVVADGEVLVINEGSAPYQVVAVAQYIPTPAPAPVEPVVENVTVYAGADYKVVARAIFTVDEFGVVTPGYEYDVYGLYVDGVALDMITFDAIPGFIKGELAKVTITNGVWEVENYECFNLEDVITYVGTGAAGEYAIGAVDQYHMAADALIVLVDDLNGSVSVIDSLTALRDVTLYKNLIVYVEYTDGLVSTMYIFDLGVL